MITEPELMGAMYLVMKMALIVIALLIVFIVVACCARSGQISEEERQLADWYDGNRSRPPGSMDDGL